MKPNENSNGKSSSGKTREVQNILQENWVKKTNTRNYFLLKKYHSVQRYKPCKFGDYDTQKIEWSLVCENMLSTKPYEHQCKYSFFGTIQNYSEKYLSTNTHRSIRVLFFSDRKTARWVSPYFKITLKRWEQVQNHKDIRSKYSFFGTIQNYSVKNTSVQT